MPAGHLGGTPLLSLQLRVAGKIKPELALAAALQHTGGAPNQDLGGGGTDLAPTKLLG